MLQCEDVLELNADMLAITILTCFRVLAGIMFAMLSLISTKHKALK